MIEGVVEKKLKLIPDERGYLMEMLRKDDDFFTAFGQVYVSATYPGVVKGWHFHKEQCDNVVCVKGMVKLVLFDNRPDSKTKGEVKEYFIGEKSPVLIHIPKGIVHGWKCITEETALVVNCPDKVYDYKKPDEFRMDPHGNEVLYDWDRKDG